MIETYWTWNSIISPTKGNNNKSLKPPPRIQKENMGSVSKLEVFPPTMKHVSTREVWWMPSLSWKYFKKSTRVVLRKLNNFWKRRLLQTTASFYIIFIDLGPNQALLHSIKNWSELTPISSGTHFCDHRLGMSGLLANVTTFRRGPPRCRRNLIDGHSNWVEHTANINKRRRYVYTYITQLYMYI